jgi:hypothetical protein
MDAADTAVDKSRFVCIVRRTQPINRPANTLGDRLTTVAASVIGPVDAARVGFA